jgi:hypothetical protein
MAVLCLLLAPLVLKLCAIAAGSSDGDLLLASKLELCDPIDVLAGWQTGFDDTFLAARVVLHQLRRCCHRAQPRQTLPHRQVPGSALLLEIPGAPRSQLQQLRGSAARLPHRAPGAQAPQPHC